jgi:peroxiredoxin
MPFRLSCGHISQDEATICSTCTRNQDQINSIAPKQWLKHVIPQNKFTMVIFYRGKWCIGCETYLKSITDSNVATQIRKAGGELYAVCAQKPEEVDETTKEWRTNFGLKSDHKNILVKKYDMGIMKIESSKLAKLKELVWSKLKFKVQPTNHEEGVAQPGLLVFNQEGSIIYSWKSPQLANNFFGGIHRINPSDVLKITEFYYGNETVLRSISMYCGKHLVEVFGVVMQNIEVRQTFGNHLKAEHAEEGLEFIDLVDKLDSKTTKDQLTEIYNKFIPQDSSKELNIPSYLRKEVTKALEEKCESGMFAQVYEHVYQTLATDSFKRFSMTEKFLSIAPKIIPQCFTSEVEECSKSNL